MFLDRTERIRFVETTDSLGSQRRPGYETRYHFNTNFGVRKQLLHFNAVARVKWIGISSSPLTLLGKDGWLYYLDGNSLDYYYDTGTFDDDQLAAMRVKFNRRRAELSKRGTEYIFMVAPSKDTIYPEYIPDRLKKVKDESMLDRIMSHMNRYSEFRILDLRPALFEAKRNMRVFYKTDTHWNQLGAYVVYSETAREMKKRFPAVQVKPLHRFKIETKILEMGDLTAILGFMRETDEPDYFLTLPGSRVKLRRFMDNNVRMVESENPDGEIRRAVIFHDSFFTTVTPFLAEHFQTALFVWRDDLDMALVERESPDIVIQEIAERKLDAFCPK